MGDGERGAAVFADGVLRGWAGYCGRRALRELVVWRRSLLLRKCMDEGAPTARRAVRFAHSRWAIRRGLAGRQPFESSALAPRVSHADGSLLAAGAKKKPPEGGFFFASGGEGGIRTHGRFDPTPDFESGTFGHSATSPVFCIRALAIAGQGWSRILLRFVFCTLAAAREQKYSRPAGESEEPTCKKLQRFMLAGCDQAAAGVNFSRPPM
jgi:hypothetical protein